MALIPLRIDKLVGTGSVLLAGAGCLAAAEGARTLSAGSLPQRVAGTAGLLAGPALAGVCGYVGYRLLRYPAERRCSAAEIQRDIAREVRRAECWWAAVR